jgi:methylmalonyl-CoA mutase
LTDLVEAAVLLEFDRITERGGVLGAMETMYQRSKIQEESLYYETLKHRGIPNHRCKYVLEFQRISNGYSG